MRYLLLNCTVVLGICWYSVQLGAFNAQYMRNPDIVYVLKMEYVYKINIFGLKMEVKCGKEKIRLKLLYAQGLFWTY